MGDQEPHVELWGDAPRQIIDQMLAQRKIFLLHERNQAAFEGCTGRSTTPSTTTFRTSFARVLADDRVSVRDRVRMAASFGAVMGGCLHVRRRFRRRPVVELSEILRDAVRDLLC